MAEISIPSALCEHAFTIRSDTAPRSFLSHAPEVLCPACLFWPSLSTLRPRQRLPCGRTFHRSSQRREPSRQSRRLLHRERETPCAEFRMYSPPRDVQTRPETC